MACRTDEGPVGLAATHRAKDGVRDNGADIVTGAAPKLQGTRALGRLFAHRPDPGHDRLPLVAAAREHDRLARERLRCGRELRKPHLDRAAKLARDAFARRGRRR